MDAVGSRSDDLLGLAASRYNARFDRFEAPPAMEQTALKNLLEDLSQRAASLRGYL